MVRRQPSKLDKIGSIPTTRSRYSVHADVAQLVERDLAKVEATSSKLVIRSNSNRNVLASLRFQKIARIAQSVERQPEELRAAGSIPAPCTT